MKAIRVSAPGDTTVMHIAEVPAPTPAAGQVVVQLKAIGVNPVDLYFRAGMYPIANYPYTPGLDGAGMVEAIGSGMTRLKVGDRVYVGGSISGTYAEKCLCSESQVHLLPERVSFAQGAGVFVPGGTAYRALHQFAHVRPGETVLIHGASGSVGLAAVQLAHAAGLIVIGSAGTSEGQELVLREGAQQVVNHRDERHFEKILELTGGRGVDVIVEMLANANLGRDLKILSEGGRVVVVGNRGANNQGAVEIGPRDLMARNAAIFGMVLLKVPERELAELHAALGAALVDGVFRPIVGTELALADARRAHELVERGGTLGKVVLIP